MLQNYSMELPMLNSQEETEWFNTVLGDSGIFRPEATVKGVWIGLEGECHYMESRDNLADMTFTPQFHYNCGSTHCKKILAIFPSPAGMSPTKLFLAGNNQIIPRQGEFGK
jgi:hypothetical protein